MTRIARTVVALTLLALLTPNPGSAQTPETSGKTFTISGQVGLEGVVMKGLPGDPITDTNGAYRASVESGWSGVVTPAKEGYVFEPPSMIYQGVKEDLLSHNYRVIVEMFTLAGQVGLADVVMKGLPGRVVTKADGSYATQVPYGWSGKVEPSKEGYEFEPVSRKYEQVAEGRGSDDYVARVVTVTICDRIALQLEAGGPDEPMAGVQITAQPGGNRAVTDADGRYCIDVPYGWSGKLLIAKAGFEFDPPVVLYDAVKSDILYGQPAPAGDAAAMRRPRATPRRSMAPGAGSGGVLVIPTKAVSTVEFAQIAEDMRVMLDILREKLNEPRTIRGVLYDYGDFFGGSARATEGLYLQGHAAVFLLRADFPLSVPPQPGEPAARKEDPSDPVWQRARQRLYTPGGAGVSQEADQKSFERLKDDLIQTLRHAANIRVLDPNEWIIVAVTERDDASSGGGFGGMSAFGMGGGMGGGMMGGGRMTGGGMMGGAMMGGMSMGAGGGVSSRGADSSRPGLQDSPESAAPTVLTLAAKKGDIDEFARGAATLEQFRKLVRVFTY